MDLQNIGLVLINYCWKNCSAIFPTSTFLANLLFINRTDNL